jgi:tetratricopeptide (TPR) repeat protein
MSENMTHEVVRNTKNINFCLVLLIKDNSDVILKCLDSVIHLIDEYVICDTGSTDNTIHLITQYMIKHSMSGYIISETQTENQNNDSFHLNLAFSKANKDSSAKYILLLQPEDKLSNSDGSLLSIEDANKLVDQLNDVFDTFYCKTISGPYQTPSQFIFKNKPYDWVYPIQSIISNNVNENFVNENFVDSVYIERSGKNLYNNNIPLLFTFLTHNPENVPCCFYLGYYFGEVGNHNEAIKYYEKVINNNNIDNNNINYKYLSFLRLGRIYRHKLNKYNQALEYFKQGEELCPQRLECPYEYICVLELTSEFEKGLKYISVERSDVKIDPSWLLVETSIYNWQYRMEGSYIAHKAGSNQLALELGLKLKNSELYPADKKSSVESNIHFFNLALTNQTKPTQKSVSTDDIKVKVVDLGLSKIEPFFEHFHIKSQRSQSIVVDNFFQDPDAVRKFALEQEYLVTGNYPGARTKSFANEVQKAYFEKILNRKITYWPGGYNASFQYTTSNMKSWIHRDMTDYSAMIYLTPDAPLNGGTRIYRHKASGLTYGTGEANELLNKDSGNEDAWDVIEEVKNVYNRCIIFDGRRSHKSHEYFGTDLYDGRLFMIFFFDVEK